MDDLTFVAENSHPISPRSLAESIQMLGTGMLDAAIESKLHELLSNVVARFGGAIEFWTVVCLSKRELGDPEQFVADKWNDLYSEVQQLRTLISDVDIPSPVAQEQVLKLMKSCTDLREVFDLFLDCDNVPLPELELAVVRLESIWHDVGIRIAFLAALIPLPEPLPRLTTEQEAYYQSILDSLFDKLAASRPITFKAEDGSRPSP